MSERPTCPTCGRSIDPLRAPVARVSGGRIVTYCSPDCARGLAPPPLDPPPEAPEAPAPPEPATRVQGPAESDITPPPDLSPGQAHAREEALAPAPPPAASAPLARRRVSRRMLGAAAGVIAVAGVVWYVMDRGPRSSAAREPAAPPAAEPAAAVPAPPPEPVAPDPAQLFAEARAALSQTLGDASPRIRLLGARALSRIGDPAALVELRRLLEADPSEIRRLEVAYALARAGDATGHDYLVAALKGSRRDTRLEAARSLAHLGDPRGRDRLRDAMSLSTLRLGAAETLAQLGDSDGMAALREALSGRNEELRMRAAVALGRAGDPAGIELLREMAADKRIEMGAAFALARLGENGVQPLLERMLALTALRVEAAEALRRLGARPAPEPLADALAAGDEIDRVSAAEAILILFDPEPRGEPL